MTLPDPPPSAAAFYDRLAPVYHLNYPDWDAAIVRQGEALDAVIRGEGLRPPCTVLDAACGIGTQSLGLAALGYRVTGSDVSAEAVARARVEAARRGVSVAFSAADMRAAADHHGRTFDVVMACDNSVPHLLDDAQILAAFRQFHRCTAPGGLCLVTVRDYAAETRDGVQARPPLVHEAAGVRRVLFQVWDFHGSLYDLALYVVEDAPGRPPSVEVHRGRYYAVHTGVLERLMREAGFSAVRRLDGVFYQPVVAGRKSAKD
jgi:SAM-dependent methyltransferase